MTRPMVYDPLVESNNQTNTNSTQAGFRETIEASNNFLSETLDKMENLYRYMFGEEVTLDTVPPVNCVLDDLKRVAKTSEAMMRLINKFAARIGMGA